MVKARGALADGADRNVGGGLAARLSLAVALKGHDIDPTSGAAQEAQSAWQPLSEAPDASA
tara:strand:- start:230 stop:412 length:183 start_codon:yes stop_codon:yes gene_type:complete